MSTSSHPSVAVSGHCLFAAASNWLTALFSAPKANARGTAPTVAAAAAPAAGPDLWKLYRMSRGRDSVNPALLTGRVSGS